jgi:quercetin dioxygenase-like cupin family protein
VSKRIFLSLIAVAAAMIAGTQTGARADQLPYAPTVKITKILRTTTTASGQPLTYTQTDKPEATMLEVEIPPGKDTGWHTHPVQGYAYVISGTLTVQTLHSSHSYTAGQGFAETVNELHDGKNFGTRPVKLVVVFTGVQGQPFAKKQAVLQH